MANLSTEIHPDSLINLLIDRRYRLQRLLGRGTFGTVFEAAEESLGQYVSAVAVKIITPRNADERVAVQREIRGLAQLSHENIIVYRTSGEIEDESLRGSVFVVTELAESSLEDTLGTAQGLAAEKVREMALSIARALAHCHRRGAVHRDVKPSNIYRVQERWKLGDFGLVSSHAELPNMPGAAQGSQAYLAPEALFEGQVTPKVDVYALGVTIKECLTGELAHAGATAEEFLENVRTQPAQIPATLGEPWQAVLRASLERHPDQRCSADDLIRLLGGAVNPDAVPIMPLPSRRPDAVIVSRLGRGQCLTLAEAIDVAEPNTRILVRPGRYRESLVLEKPLEIVGDGPVQEVVLAAVGQAALALRQGNVKIRGISIDVEEQTGTPANGIEVSGGELEMTDCRLTSASLACLVVFQPEARAVLQDCRLCRGNDVGVWVYDRGRLVLRDCLVSSYPRSGIVVGEGAEATIVSSRLECGRASGLFVYDGGRVTVDDCVLASHGKAGVSVGERGHVELENCRILGNAAYGIWLGALASARIRRCHFADNVGGRWYLAPDARMEVEEDSKEQDATA